MKLILIMSILIMFSCNYDNNEIINQKKITQDSSKTGKYIQIEIVQIAPSSIESYKNREFRLISNDSIFNEMLNKNYSDSLCYRMLKDGWDTNRDWIINAFLYAKYNLNAVSMMSYVPNKVKEWRNNQKDIDKKYWLSFFTKPVR